MGEGGNDKYEPNEPGAVVNPVKSVPAWGCSGRGTFIILESQESRSVCHG